VNAGARAEEARNCLYESGADLGSVGRGMRTSATAADRSPGSSEASQRIELHEEELRAEKERVQAGEVSGDTEAWRGNERRYRHDSSYSGPERRLSRV
jgi:stress response protein YsnF